MSERKGTKALELWCKRLVKDCPNVQIDNMTTSWRNGIAFCALVHHFRPDLIDVSKLKPEDIYENNQLAYSIAEKHLGIPSLLDPEDMVNNEVPDRLSILTYLSQFYQRLGHTVNNKSAESDQKVSLPSTTQSAAPIKFGKSGHDKCAACGLPVYLAQRLLVSHKLYHRRCFRCSKCSGHLNPKNFELIDGSEFSCDSCKNEKKLSKFLNNNDHDQMGMLAFSEAMPEKSTEIKKEETNVIKHRPRPQSVLEKISMFEKNAEKETNMEENLSNLSIKDNVNINVKELSTSSINTSSVTDNYDLKPVYTNTELDSTIEKKQLSPKTEELLDIKPEKVYRSDINKFNFLQTQLSSVTLDNNKDKDLHNVELEETRQNKEDCSSNITKKDENVQKEMSDKPNDLLKEESNITDDIRIAKSHNTPSYVLDEHIPLPTSELTEKNEDVAISVPPRRKKQQHTPEKTKSTENDVIKKPNQDKTYPKHLNPFSDDEDENEESKSKELPKKISTNPFGSTDEEDDDVPPIQPPLKVQNNQTTPVRRLIAVNPFWSDGEEPSSDEEETCDNRSNMYKSVMATSTPNLPASVPRRKKAKAPPPPVVTVVEPATPTEHPSTSMDDVASISSLSSYNSTVHSDQKSIGHSTPMMKKKRLAPTPPDSLSTVSGCGGSMETGVDTSSIRNISDGGRKMKGPAPGLPLPERREVKLQISAEELQVQLDLLETQQLGLERQGVLIEQMIRDKCEGDDSSSVPQEEVEDLVIQLCELVNEKNDLFRKQTELMYIRRQQRLEQEQADIEHEIRIIQSRPAVNRIDADKAREEQLVSRLVEIVRMRDELVQQIDAERRRERQEDLAIAASIASKRAQRNSESNSSSIKSAEVIASPKKSKVKDKVKKQLKKAKHTLISKKKEDSGKEEKPEKDKKSK
ncbi:MICAL-like protein 1 isoform X1 [Galleria mellonella]|uniref:MICAL-like protein 1 isoform X1 n=1 Tax=Galleria mellonella TaxID=7137 RepID=A0A6J1WYC2_GALME|nr:MICAL-like protein 1 isoform X1 [Galleria mellonella]